MHANVVLPKCLIKFNDINIIQLSPAFLMQHLLRAQAQYHYSAGSTPATAEDTIRAIGFNLF